MTTLRETDVLDWERKGSVPYDYLAYLSQLFHCSAADLGYPEFSAQGRSAPRAAGTRLPSTPLATRATSCSSMSRLPAAPICQDIQVTRMAC